MKIINSLTLAILVLSGSVSASAAELKLIANESVSATEISSDDVKGVFLLTKTSLKEGGHVEPVLEKGGSVHEAFLRDYVGKSDSALQTYYRSLAFTGKGSIPKQVASDADVVAYVAKTKGAIGYVAPETATSGVKVLKVK
jgi:ABC-type phosphate transport system substrate-binding protein